MQNTWSVVAFAAAAAVFVGVVVGMKRSESAVQSRAIVWSFCSLALLAALFCGIAAFGGGAAALMPGTFAALFALGPTAVYACVVVAAQRDARTLSCALRSERARSAQHAAREVRSVPLEVNEGHRVVERKPARVPSATKAEPEPAPAPKEVPAPLPSPLPVAAPLPAPAPATNPFVEQAAPVEQPVPAIAYPPPLGAVARPEAPSSTLAPVPAPVSTPTPDPVSAVGASEPTSDDCFQKAVAFKARALHVPAARLFAEAAALAASDAARRRARFEELSCYVKADQLDKARELAEELNRSSVLTRAERVKLEAVGRML